MSRRRAGHASAASPRGATVLVTDGNERSSLAVVRSLGGAGHRVHVTASEPRSLAAASRHSVEEHAVPCPLADPEDYARAVADAAAHIEADVVLPMTDPSVLAVLENRGLFDGAALPLPSLEAYRAASDKERIRHLAQGVGLAVPRQWTVPARDGPPPFEAEAPSYPVVVKSVTSVVGAGRGRRTTGAASAAGPRELAGLLRGQPRDAFPLLVQERIRGPGIGVFLLLWEGRLLAHFGHRRIREKPPTGGVSVLRESVAVEERLLEATVRLFRELGWAGVAMLECKVDEATGTPYVLEANGRFWGSLQLAVDAGVPFPRLLVEAALGRTVQPVNGYRGGIRCRWLWGDTDHLLLRWRRGPTADAGDRFGGLARALGAYLTSFRPGVRCEVMRLRDPRPFLRETAYRLPGLAGGRRRQG